MEAYLFETVSDGKVKCNLCRHRCLIKEGRRGICGVRENRAGVLHTLVFGKLIARHIDPIEKKPLYHFLPGSRSYSIATVGCNFKCRFCQNADIAQMPEDQRGLVVGDPCTPQEVVTDALKGHCRSISYTYTEPTIFFEFAYETAKLAQAKGLKNVFVTNGYMTDEALEMIQPYLDAANVDLKAFNETYYRDVCGAKLAHVTEDPEADEIPWNFRGGHDPDRARPQRRQRGTGKAGPISGDGPWAGDALAHQPFSSDLQADRPAADTAGHSFEGA